MRFNIEVDGKSKQRRCQDAAKTLPRCTKERKWTLRGSPRTVKPVRRATESDAMLREPLRDGRKKIAVRSESVARVWTGFCIDLGSIWGRFWLHWGPKTNKNRLLGALGELLGSSMGPRGSQETPRGAQEAPRVLLGSLLGPFSLKN